MTLRVLLVDDNPDDRLLAYRALARELGEVDAIEIAERGELEREVELGHFQLTVTDYQLRWGTGLDVLRAIKARYPTCPVIMYTGTGSEEVAVQAMKEGLDDYVIKAPGRQSRLVAAARSAIDRSTSQRRAAALEERLHSLLNRLHVGVFRAGYDGRLLEANGALLEILGYDTLEAARSAGVRQLLCWPEEGAGTPPPEPEIHECEVRIRRPDGEVRTLAITETLQLGPDGDPFVDGLAEDVTERRRLEERLRQAQKMESVGLLAGGIAHDFNNILTVVMGASTMLARRLDYADPRRADAEMVMDAALRATDLTGQLLAFSRKQVLQPRVIDLNEIVRRMEKLIRRLVGENIRVVVRVDAAPYHVHADPVQVEQVLLNLSSNARDAMEQGGTLTLETARATLDEDYARTQPDVRPGPYVMLAVSDTGHGMDARTKSRIFEPFFTTREAGQGIGLGLATVYGIVKQTGGHVAAYSEVGRGTTFRIYLPASAEAPAAEAPPPDHLARRAGAERILLAEDEALVRRVARRGLEEAGYVVTEAESGEDALLIAEQSPDGFHLLVTDVIMPGMSGPELARRLQARHPGLPVLFVSGYPAHAISQHGVLAPDTNFLQKPFSPQVLARRVQELLGAAS